METGLQMILARIQETTEFLGIDLADVNQVGIFGNTPLKVAVVWGDVEAVCSLLDAGADPNIRCEDGYTALHHAAAGNHVQIGRLLINKGARTDVQNVDGQTPYDLARLLGRREMQDFLAHEVVIRPG